MAFFFQNESEPVVAILDENGNQIFATIGLLSLSAKPSNKYAEHPLEDGTIISDHKIVQQQRVNVKAVLNPEDYVDVYKQLKKADENNTAFTIQTRVDTITNMYLESYPRDESAKVYGTIALTISFIEQNFVAVETEALPKSEVSNPSNSDTSKSGDKLPKKVTKKTTLQRIIGAL